MLLLALCTTAIEAQDDKAILGSHDNEIMLSLRAGHNVSFGGFAAASVEASNTLSKDFRLNSGV